MHELENIRSAVAVLWDSVVGLRQAQYVFARDLVEAELLHGLDSEKARVHRDALTLISAKLESEMTAFFRARTQYNKLHAEAHEHGHGHGH